MASATFYTNCFSRPDPVAMDNGSHLSASFQAASPAALPSLACTHWTPGPRNHTASVPGGGWEAARGPHSSYLLSWDPGWACLSQGPLSSPQVPGRRRTLHRSSICRASVATTGIARHLLCPALCWTPRPGG